MKHLYYVGNNEYNTQYRYKTYNDFSDMTIIFFFLLWVQMLFLFVKSILHIHHNSKFINYIKGNGDKEVIIIRGVPGIGKDSYVYTLEKDTNNIFTIINSDQFFIRKDKYKFNFKEITKAENECFDKYHKNLALGVNKIYITNVNNKKWMYNNYIHLAYTYNYKVKIIELVCNDKHYLHYFKKRSSHNVPLSYSKSVFNDWEDDSRVNYVEPYIGYLLGDSLPNPKKTFKQLNKELDDYKKCVIDSDSELEYEFKDTEMNVKLISLEEIDKTKYRYLDSISFVLKKNIFMYLKLFLETHTIDINETFYKPS